ncbi:MAG: POTRA domain-containing protein [Halanaerobiales bacterium]
MVKKYLLVVFLTVVIIVAGSISLMAQSEEIVGGIEIRGNKNISEEEIREKISLEPGDALGREQLQEDRLSIFEMGYFEDVIVSPEIGLQGLVVVF